MPAPLNLTGQTFGRIVVIKRHPINTPSGGYQWLCACDCGNHIIVASTSLRTGNTRSCGCFRDDWNTKHNSTHGYTKGGPTAEYSTWVRIKNRCYNPRTKKYPIYGGRGITMCDRWLHDFPAFLADIGHKPSDKHSIDRIDPDGDYTPDNCRWADAKTQANNQRRFK